MFFHCWACSGKCSGGRGWTGTHSSIWYNSSDDVHLYCLTAVTGDSVYCERVWGMAEANSPLVYYSDTEVVLSGSGIVQSVIQTFQASFFMVHILRLWSSPVDISGALMRMVMPVFIFCGQKQIFCLSHIYSNMKEVRYSFAFAWCNHTYRDVKNTTHGPAFYDLSGRRVYDNSRGIRVSKGRKYLIK